MLRYVFASVVLLVACSGKVATQESSAAPDAITPVDPSTCSADQDTCMACCQTSFPDGAAYLSRSVTRLDNIANEWCGPPPDHDFGGGDNCRDGHSADCRACASRLDARPLGDCLADGACAQMHECLKACKISDFEYGL